jgi:hypothetical protein
MATLDAVEHLVGLQSRAPLAHYVGLWSRLESFDPVAAGVALGRGELGRVSNVERRLGAMLQQ